MPLKRANSYHTYLRAVSKTKMIASVPPKFPPLKNRSQNQKNKPTKKDSKRPSLFRESPDKIKMENTLMLRPKKEDQKKIKKPMKAYASATICLASAVLFSGCSTPDRYKAHKKEKNEPQPTRLEAPFEQIREPFENKNERITTIPTSQGANPTIIEPEITTPGQDQTLYAIIIEGREGLVLSPYAPDKGIIDVRGFPAGAHVRDPYTGKVMRVPLPIKPQKEGQTLSAPTFQQPTPTSSLDTTQQNPTLQAPPTLE
jgi:hypothetical protein